MDGEAVKVVKYLIILLAGLLIAVLAINQIYFTKVIEKKQIYRIENELQSLLKSQSEKVDLLIIGDSHAKDDVNTHYINNSFNLAIGDPGGYILSYWYLRKILEDNPNKVKYVLVQIDHSILNKRKYPDPTQIDNLWFWSKYASYKEISLATNIPVADVFLRSKVLFMGSGKLIEVYLNPGSVELSEIYHGWTGNSLNLNDTKNISEADYKYYNDLFEGLEKTPSDKGMYYLLKILDLAKEKNVSIVLVKYPLSQGYSNLIKEMGFDDSSYTGSVIKELDYRNYSYVIFDYSDFFQNKTEYFADVGHLNIGGSEILSKKIREDLKKNFNESSL
jgi:hypothetical protein